MKMFNTLLAVCPSATWRVYLQQEIISAGLDLHLLSQVCGNGVMASSLPVYEQILTLKMYTFYKTIPVHTYTVQILRGLRKCHYLRFLNDNLDNYLNNADA